MYIRQSVCLPVGRRVCPYLLSFYLGAPAFSYSRYGPNRRTNGIPTDLIDGNSLWFCPSASPRCTSRSSLRSARGSTWAKRYRLCRTSRTRSRLEGRAAVGHNPDDEFEIRTSHSHRNVRGRCCCCCCCCPRPLEACPCSCEWIEFACLRYASGRPPDPPRGVAP